ncbi:MAG TPA: sigma-70 family RNA polymerase sigma factor [Planctomycetota bacterium]|nr:sigma-70 family RNA polymerase sigma factor [Planctomycetota bacterium]
MTPDPSATSEVLLLGQLGWVRRLAASLACDPEAAIDLTQQVACDWVAARPAWAERGAGLRRWLARATRSRAIDHARAERARRARERGTEPNQREEAPHAVLERLERQRRVAAAVHALPEPYRRTMLYRFLDELPTAVVAQRMAVAEPTVRKRIERGLELLRARLDREFGGSSRAWALALLDPAARQALEVGVAGGATVAVLQGAGLMLGKKLVVLAVGLALVSMAWWWMASNIDTADVEVGGRGVVVPEHVAAARQPALSVQRVEASPGPVASTAVPTPADRVFIRGFVFTDEEHRAPADLSITAERGPSRERDPAVEIDAAAGTWSLDLGHEDQVTLWVTSACVVPAQIPVPKELLRRGGVFDLHLDSGRCLILLFLDEASRAPLAHLDFELSKAIELQRGMGRVVTREATQRCRTGDDGKALVRGLPMDGALSVTTDLELHERNVLMRGGATMRGVFHGERIWSMWVRADMPRQLEQTILTRAPLGQATAAGQVPAWARAPGSRPGASGVRVVARMWSDDAGSRGDAFAIDEDAQGLFELRAQAPSRYQVWLERTGSREPLSPPVLVVFEHAGAHAPIVFEPMQRVTVRLSCTNVPAAGTLDLLATGSQAGARSQQVRCAGEALAIEVSAVAGERLRLSLQPEGSAHDKSAWSREFVIDEARPELRVDLAGSWRTVQIDGDAGALRGDGAVSLLACRNGEASIDEHIVVLLRDGAAATPVHVPPGRWVYSFSDGASPAVWGVVDVAAQPTGPLLLRPRLGLVPVGDLRPGVRFDEIGGVSLRSLPERLRTWQAPAAGSEVAFPLDAVYVKLPAGR